MSEQGWRDFVGAEGVDDWVVLHGGATAVFRVASLAEAARVAEAVARAPGVAGVGVLLTVADDRLTVRLTRDLWGLEDRHVALARTVSAVVHDHGGIPDRSAVQEVQLAIAAKPEAIDVGFWRAVLGYEPMAPTTRSTPRATARPCGCRSSTRPSRCGTRCTSTCRSPASTWRRAWRPPSPRAVASSTTPRRRSGGRSPTGRATAGASAGGRTGRRARGRRAPRRRRVRRT